MVKSLLGTHRFILQHPLCKDEPAAALGRYLRWQIGSRLLPGASIVPFVNESKIVVLPGMTGATLNVYTGLSDFSECAFLLHLLRKQDLFVDIGSNVGVYTVLAGAAIGARAIAIEPIPQTFAHLGDNIRANAMGERVTAHNIGLGRTEATLRFTADRDTMNRVVTEQNFAGPTVDVPVRTLDTVLAGESPTLMKIDVEGYESEVLAGATETLCNPSLLGLIVEMDGNSVAFNANEEAVHARLLSNGFATYAYDAFSRILTPLPSKNVGFLNTLYLRNLPRIQELVKSAPPFAILGRTI